MPDIFVARMERSVIREQAVLSRISALRTSIRATGCLVIARSALPTAYLVWGLEQEVNVE